MQLRNMHMTDRNFVLKLNGCRWAMPDILCSQSFTMYSDHVYRKMPGVLVASIVLLHAIWLLHAKIRDLVYFVKDHIVNLHTVYVY